MTLHDLGGLQLTYRTTGCNGSCFQQDFHYPSSHRGWILAVRIQVTEKLLDYQVWVLGLKENNKKPRKLLTCLEKKKNTEKKKRVREKVTENCCIEVIRLIKWQTKNWILVIKCITPLHFSFRPKMNHSCEQIGWSPNWNQWELHEYWSTFLLCTTKMCNNHLQR